MLPSLSYEVDEDTVQRMIRCLGYDGALGAEVIGLGGSGQVWRVADRVYKVFRHRRLASVHHEVRLASYVQRVLPKHCLGFLSARHVDAWCVAELPPRRVCDLYEVATRCGDVPPDTKRTWIDGMLDCVDAMHAVGLVHNDLKPENFVLDEDGHVFAIDFGFATLGAWTRGGRHHYGTDGYVHPRLRLRGLEEAPQPRHDRTTDCYALARTIDFFASMRPHHHRAVRAALRRAVALAESFPDAPYAPDWTDRLRRANDADRRALAPPPSAKVHPAAPTRTASGP